MTEYSVVRKKSEYIVKEKAGKYEIDLKKIIKD